MVQRGTFRIYREPELQRGTLLGLSKQDGELKECSIQTWALLTKRTLRVLIEKGKENIYFL